MTIKSTLSAWRLIPSKDPGDQLYNRRLMAYFSLAYCAIWFQEILFLIALGIYFGVPVDPTIIATLLGAPAALSGLGFWKYLEACKIEDKEKKEALDEPQ